jgi:hypothetical protein
MPRWRQTDPVLKHAVTRIQDTAGNLIDSALPASKDKRRVIVVLAKRSAITAHWGILSCQYNVSAGIWPLFHISSSCALS